MASVSSTGTDAKSSWAMSCATAPPCWSTCVTSAESSAASRSHSCATWRRRSARQGRHSSASGTVPPRRLLPWALPPASPSLFTQTRAGAPTGPPDCVEAGSGFSIRVSSSRRGRPAGRVRDRSESRETPGSSAVSWCSTPPAGWSGGSRAVFPAITPLRQTSCKRSAQQSDSLLSFPAAAGTTEGECP